MPTYRGPQNNGPKHASSESGNAWKGDNRVAIPANLTTADDVILLDVPAGVRLTGLKLRASDLDTGTALVVNIGYRSTHADQRVAPVTNYFLSASTSFQAAQADWVDLPFDAITFQEPVQIVLRPAVSAAGLPAAGFIAAIGEGHIVGAG